MGIKKDFISANGAFFLFFFKDSTLIYLGHLEAAQVCDMGLEWTLLLQGLQRLLLAKHWLVVVR